MKGYFDYNATTPMSDAAKQAWLSAADKHWQNPSSLYHGAGFASQALEAARERLAGLLGCDDAGRIVFTSGATESNNAIFADLARTLPADGSVIISAIEHPSVRESARHWLGAARVRELPVTPDGIAEPDCLRAALSQSRPALVSVMAANNESGSLQPWQELLRVCREFGVHFHTDAAQWAGKLPSDALGACDFITGSAHKFGGPKGVGFLVLPSEESTLHFLRGGPQEDNRRAGTENYPAIEAMVTALEQATPRLAEVQRRQALLRDRFQDALRALFPALRVIGEQAPRLWNTALLLLPRHDNLKWLTRLSRRGFSISTGSACSSGKEGSSVVVQALGANWEELKRVVRISGGWDTTAEDWQDLAGAFHEVVAELDRGGRA